MINISTVINKYISISVCRYSMQRCRRCHVPHLISKYVSIHTRQTRLLVNCIGCRQKESSYNHKYKIVKAQWERWKRSNSCGMCGENDPRLIEADHLHSKIRKCSDYVWWSPKGLSAHASELKKCNPLCIFCHRLTTQRRHFERGTQYRKVRNELRGVVNDEKLRRGECLRCKRKVTTNTFCAFDFDHRDRSTKLMRIAKLVIKSREYFYNHISTEFDRCDLLCCNCHKLYGH